MGHAGSGEGEGLHHAVAVEPVAVTVAEALVLGRTVPPQDAQEFGRQAAVQRRKRRREFFRAGCFEAEQPRFLGQRAGEAIRVPGRRTRGEQ